MYNVCSGPVTKEAHYIEMTATRCLCSLSIGINSCSGQRKMPFRMLIVTFLDKMYTKLTHLIFAKAGHWQNSKNRNLQAYVL